jgi:hypothetical protein
LRRCRRPASAARCASSCTGPVLRVAIGWALRIAWPSRLASAEREAWGVEGGVGWDGTTLQPGDRR